MMRVRVGLIACALTAVGCVNPFAPPQDPTGGSQAFRLAPTSPDNVLSNFQNAYRFRDITLYREVLAPDFRFTYNDADGFLRFYGANANASDPGDIARTQALFENATSLTFEEFTTLTSDSILADDGSGQMWAQRSVRFRLVVQFASPSLPTQSATGIAIYAFRYTAARDAWTLVRWQEYTSGEKRGSVELTPALRSIR